MPTAASTPSTAPTATNARTRESPAGVDPIAVRAWAGICSDGCGDDTGGSEGSIDAGIDGGNDPPCITTGPEWPEMLAYGGRMRGAE